MGSTTDAISDNTHNRVASEMAIYQQSATLSVQLTQVDSLRDLFLLELHELHVQLQLRPRCEVNGFSLPNAFLPLTKSAGRNVQQ